MCFPLHFPTLLSRGNALELCHRYLLLIVDVLLVFLPFLSHLSTVYVPAQRPSYELALAPPPWQFERNAKDRLAEWPTVRPLSTTLSWTIRLSLAVLWGVFWMFYPAEYSSHNEYAASDRPSPNSWARDEQWNQQMSDMSLGRIDEFFQSTQPANTYTTNYQSQNLAFAHVVPSASVNVAQPCHVFQARSLEPPDRHNLTGALTETRSIPSTPPHHGQRINLDSHGRRLLRRNQARTLGYGSHTYMHPFPDQSTRNVSSGDIAWQLTSGENLTYVPSDALCSNIEAAASSSHPPEAGFPYEGNLRFPPFAPLQKQDLRSSNDLLQVPSRVASAASNARKRLLTPPALLSSEMGEHQSYPISPPSDEPHISTAKSPDTADMSRESSPHDSAASPLGQLRRDRDPPRNGNDEIYCDHQSCADKDETFSRVCEWNKHMDKHDRPYKCHEHGCERLLGFTYSGGLLRHNREVHKKNLATRSPLFCPFPSCNRASRSGHGFTRQENLNEHKRRRHAGQLEPSGGVDASSPLLQWPTPTLNRKRKRSSEISSDQALDVDEDCESNLAIGHKRLSVPEFGDIQESQTIEALQRELQRRDRQIAQQLGEIESLKKQLRSLGGHKDVASEGVVNGQWA